MQTETVSGGTYLPLFFAHIITIQQPYYQPAPAAPAPFSSNPKYADPHYSSSQTSAWAIHIEDSFDITVFGKDLHNISTIVPDRS